MAITLLDHIRHIVAGGPGSGRHAEAGKFKFVGRDISRMKNSRFVTFYKSPSGAFVNVTRTKPSEGKGTSKSSNNPGEKFEVHQAPNGSTFGRKVYGGDRSGALQMLSDKYGINHKV